MNYFCKKKTEIQKKNGHQERNINKFQMNKKILSLLHNKKHKFKEPEKNPSFFTNQINNFETTGQKQY